jgi:ABC-type molybdate transport system substrate-binding protein
MKTVLVFFVALVLILATAQASKEESSTTFGRKVNVGGSDRITKDEAANKGSSTTTTTASTETKTVEEVNPAFQSYSGTATDVKHHYFPDDDHKPSPRSL